MHYVGERLYDEVNHSEIVVEYGIDKNAGSIISPLKIYSPTDTLGKVDAVVVTSISYFQVIKKELELKIDCPIISFDKLLEDWERKIR